MEDPAIRQHGGHIGEGKRRVDFPDPIGSEPRNIIKTRLRLSFGSKRFNLAALVEYKRGDLLAAAIAAGEQPIAAPDRENAVRILEHLPIFDRAIALQDTRQDLARDDGSLTNLAI